MIIDSSTRNWILRELDYAKEKHKKDLKEEKITPEYWDLYLSEFIKVKSELVNGVNNYSNIEKRLNKYDGNYLS